MLRSYTKKMSILGGLLLVLGLQVFAINTADVQDIVFNLKLNDSTYLCHLFSSPSDSQYWSADLIQAPGLETLTQGVYYPEDKAYFDFLALDNKGSIYLLEKVLLQEGQKPVIRFSEANKTSKDKADFSICEIEFRNTGKINLDYLFFAPQDTSSWGFDLLDSKRSLAPGASLFVLLPLSQESFSMEILAINEKEQESSQVLVVPTNDEALLVTLK